MNKKLLMFAFSAILLITGCSNDDEQTKDEVNEEELNQEETKADKQPSIDENKELTKKLQQEKGVISGQVYKEKEQAFATIELDEKITDKDANALAEKYAREIKKVYKDLNVSVIVKKDGKVVADVTESVETMEKATKETDTITVTNKSVTVKSLIEKGTISLTPNPISNQTSVVLDSTKLSKDIANKKAVDLALEIEGKTYPFTVNPFKETVFEIQNLDYSEEQLTAAQIKIK